MLQELHSLMNGGQSISQDPLSASSALEVRTLHRSPGALNKVACGEVGRAPMTTPSRKGMRHQLQGLLVHREP